MPTTIAVSPNARAWRIGDKIFAVLSDPDFIAVTSFAAIGLLATIALVFSVPLLSDVN
jgi:hypothetical protein